MIVVFVTALRMSEVATSEEYTFPAGTCSGLTVDAIVTRVYVKLVIYSVTSYQYLLQAR